MPRIDIAAVPERSGQPYPPPTGPTLHPFIRGLLLKQPETESELTQRVKGLQTAANIFDLIYKGDGGIDIRAAIANRSRRPE